MDETPDRLVGLRSEKLVEAVRAELVHKLFGVLDLKHKAHVDSDEDVV